MAAKPGLARPDPPPGRNFPQRRQQPGIDHERRTDDSVPQAGDAAARQATGRTLIKPGIDRQRERGQDKRNHKSATMCRIDQHLGRPLREGCLSSVSCYDGQRTFRKRTPARLAVCFEAWVGRPSLAVPPLRTGK